MANTAGKGKSSAKSKSKFPGFALKYLLFVLRALLLFFIILMFLVLWTDDLYDYTKWDTALGLQLLGFVGLIVGFALFFFRPNISGWVVLTSSIFFWLVTIIFRGQIWLGWLYLVFPLLGVLLIAFERLRSFSISGRTRRN